MRPQGCRCNHTHDWHRTASGACTHEVLYFVLDEMTDRWGRCECTGWDPPRVDLLILDDAR